MTAYYNEHEPYAAQWLRNLIAAGHIAPGDVDERSIEDVAPSDLVGYRQCHFFAGIGVWSYALRRAGIGDDEEIWTGSCPCQPFSAAGKGEGFADERHLWPAFFWLIRQRRPVRVLGEQVASRKGLAWLDAVCLDLEGEGYAIGAADLCSEGFGAPHIRQRLYWMAHHSDERRVGRRADCSDAGRSPQPKRLRSTGGVADADAAGRGEQRGAELFNGERQTRRHDADGCGPTVGVADASPSGETLRMADPGSVRLKHDGPGENAREARGDSGGEGSGSQRLRHELVAGDGGASERPGPTNGFWRDADWLLCRDGKWRPARPGSFPLAHGAPARVGRLRAYGNAINAEVAEGFIRVVKEMS